MLPKTRRLLISYANVSRIKPSTIAPKKTLPRILSSQLWDQRRGEVHRRDFRRRGKARPQPGWRIATAFELVADESDHTEIRSTIAGKEKGEEMSLVLCLAKFCFSTTFFHKSVLVWFEMSDWVDLRITLPSQHTPVILPPSIANRFTAFSPKFERRRLLIRILAKSKHLWLTVC